MPYFWNYWSPDKSSAEFLMNDIHKEVEEKYFTEQDSEQIKQQQKNAELLTKFFSDLKDYGIKKQHGILDKRMGLQWGASIDLFYAVVKEFMKGIKNQDSDKGLFGLTNQKNAASPVVFQNQINAILKGIAAFSNAGVNKTGLKTGNLFKSNIKDTLKLNYIVGNKTYDNFDKTFIDFIGTNIGQIVARHTIRATKTVLEEGEEKQKYTDAIFKQQKKAIKADIANVNSFNLQVLASYGFSEKFLRVASLLSQCSFSLKNYKQAIHGKKNLISIGQTNILSILLLFLPTLSCVNSLKPEAFFSFIMALTRRYFLGPYNGKSFQRYPQIPSSNVDIIGLHFFHIQTVYELAGIGQQSSQLSSELNNFLKQGVQYLLVNDWNGVEIKVYSVKQLLYESYRESFSDLGRKVDYRRGSSSAIARYVRVANYKQGSYGATHNL